MYFTTEIKVSSASTQNLQSPQAAKSLLVVAGDREQIKRYASDLKGLPLKLVRAMDSGPAALKYVASYPIDVVLCDSSLVDTDLIAFLRGLKQNPSSRQIPVVITAESADRRMLLQAVSMGCAGLILKPYQGATLHKHMSTALNMAAGNEQEAGGLRQAKDLLASGHVDDAIREFEDIVRTQDQSEAYYMQGLEHLRKGEYGEAIACFHKAVQINTLFAEAYEAMARAFEAKGDRQSSRLFLKKAAQVHAEFQRLEQVKELFVEVMAEEPDAENPFLLLGNKLYNGRDFQGAAQAYENAIKLNPNDAWARFHLARVRWMLGHRNKAVELLESCLAMRPDFPEAQRLLIQVKNTSWATIDTERL
ncbi:CheY-like receiver domain and a GGDEF domain containing response regulator [Desulfocurvibacter africanus PCS]|uniref:CheY-like receiver domain and a GGDEF domain containing response regulator n=1 Tax=Desulfocurvibacter africanus PCS TaxID=1262666 RepID=M5PPS3_DESAF|nr:CheY-like receiver domain and a GGDEF domain containing response regulator [Desulfocurvibacter africanus PCS]